MATTTAIIKRIMTKGTATEITTEVATGITGLIMITVEAMAIKEMATIKAHNLMAKEITRNRKVKAAKIMAIAAAKAVTAEKVTAAEDNTRD